MNAQDEVTPSPDEVRTRIIAICNEHRELLLAIVGLCMEHKPYNAPADPALEENRRILDGIKAKEYATPNEAALLLNCSAQHLRNLVDQARQGKAEYPIPFCDLSGPITFPVSEVLKWARIVKPKGEKNGTRKNKSRLEVVAS